MNGLVGATKSSVSPDGTSRPAPVWLGVTEYGSGSDSGAAVFRAAFVPVAAEFGECEGVDGFTSLPNGSSAFGDSISESRSRLSLLAEDVASGSVNGATKSSDGGATRAG